MKRLVLEGFVAANLIVGFSVQSWAQQPVPQQADIGKAEYQSSCAARGASYRDARTSIPAFRNIR